MKADSKIITAALILITGLTLVYNNHFDNQFHFDDAHTIQTNAAIRDIGNIPTFFTDATTTSSLPANQAYRPGLTTLNAIDFWISGADSPEPFQFHLSIFISYVILGILLYFFFLYIFQMALENKANKILAVIAAAFFCYHTANAETINYIIARSDSFSTLMIIASLVTYFYFPQWRKFYLFTVFMVIGFFVKEPAVMIVPLLFIFILLFESKLSYWESIIRPKEWVKPLLVVAPIALIAVLLFAFSRQMTPKTWTSGGLDTLGYIRTQAFVVVHYFNNFFLPFNLSADTDWKVLANPFDDRVIIGVLFILTLLGIAFWASTKKKTRPIAFGIVWFFVALAPTSFMPFAEVLNDHRVFFPYIGLVMATVWGLGLVYYKYEEKMSGPVYNVLWLGLAVIVIAAHGYGTYQRNEVWDNGESLWKDVTIKSPENGRGWMNYGNALMAKAQYDGALECYNRSMELMPQYSYLHINMGILHAAMGKHAEAEVFYKNALKFNSNNPEAYSYYGKWLYDRGRYAESVARLKEGLALSPQHNLMNAYFKMASQLNDGKNPKLEMLKQLVEKTPTAENYLNLSLEYYNLAEYLKCVEACEEALKLKPNYDLAYNNMCSAYNKLKMWDKAVEAGKKAVKLKPDNQLFKNNLNVALAGQKSSN